MPDLQDLSHDQLTALGPVEFVALLKTASDKEVKAVMTGPTRLSVIDSIFEHMPSMFRSDRAGGMHANTHWTITGDGVPHDHWTVRIEDGQASSARGHEGDPSVTLSMGAVEFIKLVTKTGNPIMMVMMGKITIRGDMALAANIGNLFDVPRA
ncbi:MAG TPA: SCP2 sterol-binding domain-containing protein [Humibacillus sp.]|nr:SCP2 sterol-binding domain-containing protein [Humibacillus sp.]